MKKTSKKNTKPWQKFHAFKEVEVRWRDLDAYNHVTNSVYFNFFEEARIHLYNKIRAFRDSWQNKGKYANLGMTLIRTACEFRAQAFLGQKLIVGVNITRAKKFFVDTEYTVFDKKTQAVIAKGTATNALIDKQTFKPISIPKEILDQIEQLK
ncbi:MAG: acyl-CoA thioesterase [Candidatus Hydrogenedentota bacterium]|nr:MAG: acyl-CoA thioesterase [Candidatus Hydrogenedentota bacterium]